jgi:hypothetical protein
MNEIIEGIKDEKGYRMGNTEINIICYVDDTVLTVDNEFNLHQYLLNSQKYNVNISINKTKTQQYVEYPPSLT